MRTIKIAVVLAVCIALFQASPLSIFSQNVYAASCKSEQSLLGIPPWYHGLCKDGTNDVEIADPGKAAVIILLNVISIVLRLASYGAVGYVIWGGVQYIIANGDAGKLASAKKTIQNALTGLLIALSAVAIVTFIGGVYT